ncbi:MAG: hypothetical protein ACTSVI_01130 [Promethearchaeota archaeon]
MINIEPFSRLEKAFILIFYNLFVFIILLILIFYPLKQLSMPGKIQLSNLLLILGLVPSILLIGKFTRTRLDVKKFLIIIFISRVITLTFLELINNVQGGTDAYLFMDYGQHWISGTLDEFDRKYTLTYYFPPGTTYIYVFMYLINPWKTTYIYHLVTHVFEIGVLYMMYKIYLLFKGEIDEKYFKNGFIFFPFSGISILVMVMFGKFDIIIILACLVGIYFYFRKKIFKSMFFLTFAGFAKLFSFLWVLGILIQDLKKKNLGVLKKEIASLIVSAVVIYTPAVLVEGFKFIVNLSQFRMVFYDFNYLFNTNYTFFLMYLNIPFYNIILYGVLISAILIYFFKFVKEINLKFFIMTYCILIAIYPSINVNYFLWIAPLFYIYLMKSIRFARIIEVLIYSYATLEIGFNVYIIFFSGYELIDAVIIDFTTPPTMFILIWRLVILFPFYLLVWLIMFRNKLPEIFVRDLDETDKINNTIERSPKL